MTRVQPMDEEIMHTRTDRAAGVSTGKVALITGTVLLVSLGAGFGVGFAIGNDQCDASDAPQAGMTSPPSLPPSTTLPPTPSAPKVLITEYLESGNDKAVEVSNVGDAAADFSQQPMSIVMYRNGDESKVGVNISLSGTLAPGEAVVIAFTQVNDVFKSLPQLQGPGRLVLDSGLNFNGDDPIALEADGMRIDMIGAFGMPDRLEDVVLRRKAGELEGNPEGFASAKDSAFEQLLPDDISGFGCSGAGPCGSMSGSPATPSEPTVPVGSCGDGTETRLHAVQGSSSKSPMEGETVVVEAVFTGTNAQGYFLQEEDAHADDDAATSEGIHVRTASLPDAPRNSVLRVVGIVEESFGMTSLKPTGSPILCTAAPGAPVPVEVDTTDADAMEAAEGMLFSPRNKLVVVNTYNTWRRGELEVAPEVLWQASSVEVPGTAAHAAHEQANERKVFVIEDESSTNDPQLLSWYPYVPHFQKPINIGASVTKLMGPLFFSYEKWRTTPVAPITLEDNRPFQDGCGSDVPGVDRNAPLSMSSFNVLNYFNGQQVNGQTIFEYEDNRGAKTAMEFELQAEKIVNALVAMDSDVVGLMEIENDGFGDESALATLVQQLNARLTDSAKHYKFVQLPDSDRVGTDAITSGLLYRPAKVEPVGDAWVVAMPRQRYTEVDPKTQKSKSITKQMRPSLVQTLRERRSGLEVTVAVSHFKSKGSPCFEDVSADWPEGGVVKAQGSCNGLRVKAALALGEAMKDTRVASRVLLLGDFNSYEKEDPIAVLTDYNPATHPHKIQTAVKLITDDGDSEGHTEAEEVNTSFGYQSLVSEGYSYVFSGRAGSLDYAFGNALVAADVTSAVHWNINANELYQMTYFEAWKGFPGYLNNGVYRSSDHNPVIVTLDLQAP